MHVIGTAGHVDHGKSTLVERLTGIDPDRFAEEKRRGLTIDLGFAWLSLPSGEEIGLVDVPGHERFIKNMLAGAGGINVCLFVVAANEGWMPQSAEHLAILEVLGVSHGVVALTKSDVVDEETLDLAALDVREHLAPSLLADAPVVPVSGVTGAGIDDLLGALDRVVAAAPPAPDVARARLWVDRVFSISGAGTVVTGTLAGGSVEVGAEVEILPEGRRARIRTIQSHKRKVDAIGPGNRTALNLAGLDRQGAERGDAVAPPGVWTTTRRVDAIVSVLDPAISGVDHELTEKGAHLLHVGSAETPVRVRLLEGARVAPGERALAQLQLRDPLPLGPGDRFVLRDAGRVLTFGGGRVLDPAPGVARRNDEERIESLRRLVDASTEQALAELVERHGLLGTGDALARSGATRPTEDVVVLGDHLASPGRVQMLEDRLLTAVGAHEEASPLEGGMNRELLRADLDLGVPAFEALLARVEEVEEAGALVRLVGSGVRLSPAEEAERDRVVAEIEAGGFSPPMEKELGAAPELLRALTSTGDLVKIGDFYLTAEGARRAREVVRSGIEEKGPLSVAAIRDLLGTSRKYAVPLCEWLDQTGATLRRGDERILGPTP